MAKIQRAVSSSHVTDPLALDLIVEQSFGGPLGTLIAGVGMSAYYLALLWVNVLLGMFLTPFFLIPLTWVQDWWLERRKSVKA